MRTLEVLPGLRLDEEMFAAAADGVRSYAPQLDPLTWDTWTSPGAWWLVPGPDDDAEGRPVAYKAEHVLVQTPDLTVKVNIWYAPDLRSAETSRPHTHPWEVMEAHPVMGGYVDEHWHRTAAGLLLERGATRNTPGAVNRLFARDYHEVTEIEDPGRTVSVMVCGKWVHDEARQGIWGHLDLHTGYHVPVQRDPVEQARFRARLYAINPQHQH